MLSQERRFLFIDTPHTDGTAIQRPLAPYSDDRIVVQPPQDGVATFEVVGPHTARKHQTLAEYEARLGADAVAALRVAAVCRNPWERAVAAYFAPIAWMRRTPAGDWAQTPPVWTPALFSAMITGASGPSTCRMLQASAGMRTPDHLIRHERYGADAAAFAAALGLALPPIAPPPIPQAADGAYRDFFSAKDRAIVAAKFADDITTFGYAF